MAWVGTRTWVAGELVTAALGNSAWRDNIDALYAVITTITTTGNQTALPLPTAAGRGDLVVVANNVSLLTLQGIAAGYDGQSLTIVSKGAGQVDLANEHASATAPDRIINGPTCTLSLAPGTGRVRLVYDATTGRWRVVEHEQGAWLGRSFNAAHYSTTGGGTWTVAVGDVSSLSYYLKGSTLTVQWAILTSTLATTPARLEITIPNSCTAAHDVTNSHHWADTSGGTSGTGLALVTGAGGTISLSKDATAFATAFPNTTDTFNTRGTITFDVQ